MTAVITVAVVALVLVFLALAFVAGAGTAFRAEAGFRAQAKAEIERLRREKVELMDIADRALEVARRHSSQTKRYATLLDEITSNPKKEGET
jgi:hypothetical protein